jgi:hypothetical protein
MKITSLLKYFFYFCILLFFKSDFLFTLNIQDFSVKITKIEIVDGKYVVYYNLIGAKDEKYIISLYLRKRSDESYRYKLNNVTEDVGEGYFAGVNRKIIWDIKSELQTNQLENDFYFVLGAKESVSGISPLVWIGAGVAILGGGAAYYFLKVKKNNNINNVVKEGPDPPGRP